jgi:transposase
MGYIQGRGRDDVTMFPEALDDYVTPDNPVRVIDAFVDAQDLKRLGFERAEPAATGRPGYSPRCLLKLYLYGYMNRVRGSRALEREAGRNIEVLWLTGMLKPDFKTLADFRGDNGKAIQAVCREFTLFCAREGLIKGELVAIDGSKFKAVNSAARNFSQAKLNAQIEALDARAKQYLEQMERADAGDPGVPSGEDVKRALENLRERKAKAQGRLDQLAATGQSQISLTDADARAMKTGMHERVVGYNVQTAVDAQHKLIVAHEVTNEGNDRNELGGMAVKAKDILKRESLQVVVDTGYSNADEVARCEAQGITVYLNPPTIEGNEQRDLYGKPRFHYDEQADLYRCPAGQSLTYSSTSQHAGRQVRLYRTSACGGCSQRPQCTSAKERGRVITRAINQGALDAAARRARDNPQIMRERKCVAEHPFGTIKRGWGYGFFLMRGMAKVRTELSLTVLVYNMRRAINILGTQRLVGALK